MTGHGMLLAEQSRAEQSRAEQSRAEQTEFCIFVLPVIIYISINVKTSFVIRVNRVAEASFVYLFTKYR